MWLLKTQIITKAKKVDCCDPRNEEYGTRVGYWRVVETFDRYNIKITVSTSGKVTEFSPWLIQDAFSRGHEIAAHCHSCRNHSSEEEEAEAIVKSISTIQKVTGNPPLGWHTHSDRNSIRKLLVDKGFLYSDGACNDEIPYFVKVGDQLHLILPHSYDTNDVKGRTENVTSFAKYICDSFDWLVQREGHIPRMMTIRLHLRIVGRPGRMNELETILSHIISSGKAWITPREHIARYWIALSTSETPLPPPSVPSLRVSSGENSNNPLNTNDDQSKANINNNPQTIGEDKVIDCEPFNLLIINPNTSTEATELVRSRVEKLLPPSVKITAITATEGESYIASEITYARGSVAALDVFLSYINSPNAVKPDGVLIACFGDCGAWPIREYFAEKSLSVPVIGLAEASMRKASMKGRFAVVTGGKAWAPILSRLAKGWNLNSYVTGIHTVSLNGAQLFADRANAIRLLRETSLQAIISANGKADKPSERCSSIILGGAMLSGLTGEIQRDSTISIPLIDSVAAGVEMIVKAVFSESFRSVLV